MFPEESYKHTLGIVGYPSCFFFPACISSFYFIGYIWKKNMFKKVEEKKKKKKN